LNDFITVLSENQKLNQHIGPCSGESEHDFENLIPHFGQSTAGKMVNDVPNKTGMILAVVHWTTH
jgi:hypothetical protein